MHRHLDPPFFRPLGGGRIAYTLQKAKKGANDPTGQVHTGAYSIRPYMDHQKLIKDRLAYSMKNPILTGYRIQ